MREEETMNWRCLRHPDASILHRRRWIHRYSRCVKYQQNRNENNHYGQNSDDRKQIDSEYIDEAFYNHRVFYLNKYNLTQNGSWLPTSHSQPTNTSVPMRLLWFRTTHPQQPKVVTLLNRFGKEGLDIQVVELSTLGRMTTSGTCELIMLECINAFEHEMLEQLYQVRTDSHVPLIVLTDNHTLDWSLLALREGADAIFTLNTPDDIIIARSNALLRRWTTN